MKIIRTYGYIFFSIILTTPTTSKVEWSIFRITILIEFAAYTVDAINNKKIFILEYFTLEYIILEYFILEYFWKFFLELVLAVPRGRTQRAKCTFLWSYGEHSQNQIQTPRIQKVSKRKGGGGKIGSGKGREREDGGGRKEKERG